MTAFKYGFFIICLLFTTIFITKAQIASPDNFLGYSLGSRFTPHYRLTEYFKSVEAAVPANVKLIEYGRSYEGRPLFVAVITSASNMERLDQIRQNNLRLALIAKDRMAPDEEAPAIVWLSYNVHGNEASSSEASMQTLYELANSSDSKVKEWLENTVIVMDPCLNPDGRDRYVNWFQSVSGKSPDFDRMSREHIESWPGSRTNHYYFDLNRDWAWQTQTESAARIALYNKWMPQVHVDYHEQGMDEPYYFPPAAEPFHEVITPWQRSFQDSIGRNHARYFDSNSWLYFTKLRFDLLYPSYGDTYPTYNGAVGMTYEQAGIGAGLAVKIYSGDTLSLKDRILHHHTTALSTIEICSKLRKPLIREFRAYFSKSVNTGFGQYKTYIIKGGQLDQQKISSLQDLLEKNNIRYGSASGNVLAYHYASGVEKSISIDKADLVISTLQPKSALIQVLMEPVSKLTDSVTYDITAWSLPFVYGFDAYASKQVIKLENFNSDTLPKNQGMDSYAYIIKWEGIKSAKAVSLLLKNGVMLRYNEMPFKVNGISFNRGSIAILKNGNKHLNGEMAAIVKKACDEAGVYAYPVSSGYMESGPDFGSDFVQAIRNDNIILVSGENVSANSLGSIWHFFDQQLDYSIRIIDEKYLSVMDINSADIIILPSGSYSFLSEKNEIEALHDWIQKGGRLIAVDEAVAALSRTEWSVKTKKNEDGNEKKDVYDALKIYEKRERDYMKNTTSGSIYRVDLDTTHPLAFGYTSNYYTLKQNEHIYDFISSNGWNVGTIKQSAQKAGFVGSKLKSRLNDGLVFGVQNIGRGTVVYLTDDILFRSFWENGKLMLCNAVFFRF